MSAATWIMPCAWLVGAGCAPPARPPSSGPVVVAPVASRGPVPTPAAPRGNAPRPSPPARPTAPPAPPSIDAEQRALLDALEAVATALATTRAPREIADALGRAVKEVERGRFEVEPRDPALTRIGIAQWSASQLTANVTARTSTTARILSTQFGDFEELVYLHEFDAAYPLVACRTLPDGDELTITINLDGHPTDPGAVRVTDFEIERRAARERSSCASR